MFSFLCSSKLSLKYDMKVAVCSVMRVGLRIVTKNLWEAFRVGY